MVCDCNILLQVVILVLLCDRHKFGHVAILSHEEGGEGWWKMGEDERKDKKKVIIIFC